MTDGKSNLDIAARLSELSPEKRALLLRRLGERRGVEAKPREPEIPRVTRTGSPLPLSFAETRAWFLDQYDPGTPAYTVSVTNRLRGPLEVTALRGALVEMVRRHESLRTRYVASEGEPRRVVDPPGSFELQHPLLEPTPGQDREARAMQLLDGVASRPFDLAREPLFRAVLVSLADDDHLLLLAMHHIIADGWSLDILATELSSLYAAAAQGTPSPLAELPIQYADYAAWERAPAQTERLQRQLSYWKEELAHVPPLDLPTDHPRPPVQQTECDWLTFALDTALTNNLRALGREENCSLFMVLLGAVSILLGRHSGQQDFALGTPIAHRTRVETEPLIGFFANTLVMRVSLEGDPTVREILGRVREKTLSAYANQDVPFERLVEELRPARDLARAPVCQVLIALQNVRGERLSLAGVEVSPLSVGASGSPFDLSVFFWEANGELEWALRYSKALFDPSTIGRMAGHLRPLLEGMTANPERRVHALPMLGEAERRQLLVEWNPARQATRQPGCVHELFEEQAARTPDATAILFGDQRMTYRELNESANGLGRRLQLAGVSPDTLVGVCVERSPALVVALFAILKTGAGFVAFDRRYPGARLELMQQEAKVGWMICESEEELPAGLSAPNIVRLAGRPEGSTTGNLRGVVSRRNIAYLVFTSGSSGTPKGVMLEHGGLTDYARAIGAPLALGEHDVYLHTASFSFSSSVRQLFAPLVCGGAVALASDAQVQDVGALPGLISSWGVTCLDLVPSYLRAFVDELEQSPESRGTLSSSKLRQVALASEPLPVELVKRWLALFGARFRVLNMYGQTETTGIVNTFAIETAEGIRTADTVAVGRPLATVSDYILDDWMQPVPVGVYGQLFVATTGLGRAYVARPGATAERFVPNPFGSAGGRMYRTGDLARFDANGTIEFKGRADHQVKIRGFRVEPGDVEAALARCPSVREAVVVPREHTPGDNRLVAYVVLKDAAASPVDLRALLERTLPDYMVPSAFVTLKEMPLTPSGKLDRRALPAPQFGSATAYIAPSTPAEIRLAGIWKEMLKVERVGAQDSFFELGGHSLLAMRMVARVARELGAHLSIRAIFETPQLASLASAVDRLTKAGIDRVVPLVRVARGGEMPLSYEEETSWRWHQVRPRGPGWNTCRPQLLAGPLDLKALERAVSDLAERHETLRMAVQEVEGRLCRRLPDNAGPPLELVDLSGLGSEEEKTARVVAAAHAMEARRFDFEKGPMITAALLRLAPDRHALLTCTNHLAADAEGGRVLVRDLERLYGHAVGVQAPLPELPVQMADYAAWQRLDGASARSQSRLAFWKQKLAGAEPIILPVDRGYPADRLLALPQPFRIARPVVDGLSALAKEESASLFNVLVAAFKALMHGRSGQTDLTVGTTVSTHEQHEELAGVIGHLTDHLLLRSDASGNPTFRELVRRVKTTTLDAFANAAPLQLVAGGASPMDHPLLRVMINFFPAAEGGQEKDAPADTPTGLRFDYLDVPDQPKRVLKFDLLLVVFERAAGCGGSMFASEDLFDRATIAKMVADYLALLEEAATDSDRSIAGLAAAAEAKAATRAP